jgi:hypothetical protein
MAEFEGEQAIMDRLRLPWAAIWRLWRYKKLPLVWIDSHPTLSAEDLAAWEADAARRNQ